MKMALICTTQTWCLTDQGSCWRNTGRRIFSWNLFSMCRASQLLQHSQQTSVSILELSFVLKVCGNEHLSWFKKYLHICNSFEIIGFASFLFLYPNVSDIVFPTAWVDEVPFLTAPQVKMSQVKFILCNFVYHTGSVSLGGQQQRELPCKWISCSFETRKNKYL